MEQNVIAKVGQNVITKEQMIGIIRTLPQQQAMEVSTVEGRKMLLDEMIAGELFFLEAAAGNFEADEAFQSILTEAKKSLLQRYGIQKLLGDLKVDFEEVAAYYEANKQEFLSDSEVSARHILVDSLELCEQVKTEIAEGLAFEEAAMQYSSCPSKERGGQLGSFGKGRMVPEFEAAAFELPIGEVSAPVQTQFGYHLIVVDDKTEGGQLDLADVSEQIQKQLLNDKHTTVYRGHVEALKAQYPVEINEEALK